MNRCPTNLDQGTIVNPFPVEYFENLTKMIMLVSKVFRKKSRIKTKVTLGPAYNGFGYYEHLAITSRLFSQKRQLLIDNNV